MLTARRRYLSTLIQRAIAVMIAAACMLAPRTAAAEEPGVSHALAQSRAARVAALHYALDYTLTAHAETTTAHEVLTFTLAAGAPADLPLDFRDGAVQSAALNGQPIALTLSNGHLALPAAQLRPGLNHVELAFTANVAAAGKAITRYEDRDDHNEYLYTLFVPMDASMAFPCFDQPDLKARFTLTVTAPAAWTVIANTAPEPSSTPGHTVFPETLPISTYLFAFAAGPFTRIAPAHPGEPALYVRASQAARAHTEAPEVQATTARGIAYLSDYFQQPFPFPKYDLVLIPGFPFGGMEHAGATFLNEDGVLFRTAPTQADYFRRDILVLHETTHQWFGDLVTMRWFDDLWLKEGFAQYMAYHAMAALKPETNPSKHFYEDIKPLAYAIDETQGTTPIYQNIPNLKDAKSAYGAIVYQKAPAVLKQLEFFLGDRNFRDGLRLYLKQHAYANAQWADLIGAFEQASQANQQPKDVQTWAKAWILQRGVPQVDVSFTCSGDRLSAIELHQHDVLGTKALWPISNEIIFDSPAGERPMRVDWHEATETLTPTHTACPRFVFANFDDQAYGRFLLDPTSEKAVTAELRAITPTKDPLLHTQLWGALWDNVRVAASAPRSYAELILATLPTEPDESLNRIQGGRLATALHLYLGPQSRAALLPSAENTIAARMLHAPALGLRIVNFRTYTSIAETPAALTQLKSLLNGSLTVPGMPLRPLDRWNLIGHLIGQHDPDAHTLYTAEQTRDHTGEGQKYAYAVLAGTPDPAIKARYFTDYLTTGTRQEDWLTQSLGPFNSWNQSTLTAPYLTRALDALPEIKRDRKIFFLGAWLGAWLGAFLGGQTSPEADAAVHTWLAQPNIDPDLRLKVLENLDALDRTVRIRSRFPD